MLIFTFGYETIFVTIRKWLLLEYAFRMLLHPKHLRHILILFRRSGKCEHLHGVTALGVQASLDNQAVRFALHRDAAETHIVLTNHQPARLDKITQLASDLLTLVESSPGRCRLRNEYHFADISNMVRRIGGIGLHTRKNAPDGLYELYIEPHHDNAYFTSGTVAGQGTQQVAHVPVRKTEEVGSRVLFAALVNHVFQLLVVAAGFNYSHNAPPFI